MPKLPEVISEDDDPRLYHRLREETLRRSHREPDPYRRRQDPGPQPRDRYWHEQRCWDGIVRYAPGSGPSDDWVRHQYNPLDALDD
jgi:hypothetical protein